MKTICVLFLATMMTVAARAGDEWRRVAFFGGARVMKISGVVEVVAPENRVLRKGETARAGETLKIWRGAELILVMESSQSLVRAEGPVLLRLAQENSVKDRAALTEMEDQEGFVVRAVRGKGKFYDGQRWRMLRMGMTLPEGAKVRPFRDSILDFYHPGTRTALRVTDSARQTTLAARVDDAMGGTVLAAKAP